MNYTRLAKELEPFIVRIAQRAASGSNGNGTSGGGGDTGGTLGTHGLYSPYHTGPLAKSQAPQFLLRDGTRSLTGDLSVAPGVLIDTVDISAHAANPDAHHNRASAGNGGITVSSTQAVSLRLRASDPGLVIGTDGARLGLPGTLSWQTPAKLIDGDAHYHPIQTSSNVGNPKIASILRSTADGYVTTAGYGAWGNLDFIGGDRLITGTHNLTLSPAVDLVLDPDALVVLPNDQEMRSASYQDIPQGISGLACGRVRRQTCAS